MLTTNQASLAWVVSCTFFATILIEAWICSCRGCSGGCLLAFNKSPVTMNSEKLQSTTRRLKAADATYASEKQHEFNPKKTIKNLHLRDRPLHNQQSIFTESWLEKRVCAAYSLINFEAALSEPLNVRGHIYTIKRRICCYIFFLLILLPPRLVPKLFIPTGWDFWKPPSSTRGWTSSIKINKFPNRFRNCWIRLIMDDSPTGENVWTLRLALGTLLLASWIFFYIQKRAADKV